MNWMVISIKSLVLSGYREWDMVIEESCIKIHSRNYVSKNGGIRLTFCGSILKPYFGSNSGNLLFLIRLMVAYRQN